MDRYAAAKPTNIKKRRKKGMNIVSNKNSTNIFKGNSLIYMEVLHI